MNPLIFKTGVAALRIPTVTIVALCLSNAVVAESDSQAAAAIEVFNGSAVAPFQLFVGDKAGWAVPVGESAFTSNAGLLTVETDPEKGAISATWLKKGEAQLYFANTEPQDLIASVEADAALVVSIQINKPPNKQVTLRMGCGYPCAANADISKLLKALPENEWLRVSFDLRCFANGGLNVSNVDTPFLLLTSGKLSVTIADVRLVPGAGPDATIKCR